MDTIQACVPRPSFKDASLAPKIGEVLVVNEEISAVLLSSGNTTDPQICCNAGDRAKNAWQSDFGRLVVVNDVC